jgi:hypothetical protein
VADDAPDNPLVDPGGSRDVRRPDGAIPALADTGKDGALVVGEAG